MSREDVPAAHLGTVHAPSAYRDAAFGLEQHAHVDAVRGQVLNVQAPRPHAEHNEANGAVEDGEPLQ